MGNWARLTALAAVAGTGLAVVSGAAGWDTAHRLLAALALPPLAALVAIAWVERAPPAACRRSRRWCCSGSPRCSRARPSTWSWRRSPSRDRVRRRADVPRARRARAAARLRDVDEAADHVAAAAYRRRRSVRRRRRRARGWACSPRRWSGLALACGGASALNHYLDRDIDKLMGSRTEQRPVASGRVAAGARARVRARTVGVLVRPPRLAGQPPDRTARARRQPLLRARLHALAEAVDAAEHRDRWRCGRGAATRRLRGRGRATSALRRS